MNHQTRQTYPMNDRSSRLSVAILLYETVDLLDAGGPYEVFLTASRLMQRDGADRSIDVTMFTMDGKPVNAYGGLGLIPHSGPEVLSDTDVLLVPGTIDIAAPLKDQAMIHAIQQFGMNTDTVVASVCTGAFLLAEAGLMNQRSWTTHWEDIDLLTDKLGKEGAVRNTRWVDSGRVVSAGGLACGIDMALHLVGRYFDKTLAERTARQLDYPIISDQAECPVAICD